MIAGFGTLPKAPPVEVVVQASPPQAAVRHEGGKGLARERWTPPIAQLPPVQQAVVLNARSMAEAESNDSCVPFDQAEAMEQMFGVDPGQRAHDQAVAELFGPDPSQAAKTLIGDADSILGDAGEDSAPPETGPGMGLTEAEIRKSLPGVSVRRVFTAPETMQPPPPVAPSGPVAMVLPRPVIEPSPGVVIGASAVSNGSNSIQPFASAPAPARKRAPRAKAASAKPKEPEAKAEPSRERRVAAALGVDLAAACPVCEAVDPCACSEEERTFARRTRRGFAGVLRCSLLTCQAPLSVLYLPRVSAPEKDRGLVHYTAVHLCAACQGDGIAAILGAP